MNRHNDSLDLIGLRHGTDKSSASHNYLEIYEKFLPRRDENFVFLEFGVHHGASARTWSEYFPNATYVGLDKRRTWRGKFGNNCNFFAGNVLSPQTIVKLARMFEAPSVILDDASHKWSDQREALFRYWPWLQPGGLFIIEDLHTSNEPGYAKNDLCPPTTWLATMFEGMQQRRERWDHFATTQSPELVELVDQTESMTFIRSAALLRKRSTAPSRPPIVLSSPRRILGKVVPWA